MSQHAADEQHLHRALELARQGIGLASPNPYVGAVITDAHGNVVGTGSHTWDGVKHAEILALEEAGAREIEEDFDQMMTAEEKDRPEIAVVRQVAAGSPRSALLSAAAGAQLLVVGGRGRGGAEGMSLGSAAQAMLHLSPCPVGLIRA